MRLDDGTLHGREPRWVVMVSAIKWEESTVAVFYGKCMVSRERGDVESPVLQPN
jgi:hypothetical protein